MPKLKTERDPWEKWKGMVLAAKERLKMTDEDIAARLVRPETETGGRILRSAQNDKTRKVSRQMVTKWRKDPDAMPFWAYQRINRVLEIEASAAREAAVVWR